MQLNQLKSYDIVLFKTDGTIFSKILSFLTRDIYTHCALVMYDDVVIDIDIRNKKFITFKSLSKGYKNVKCDVYRFNEQLTDRDITELNKFIVKCENSRIHYDVLDCILLCLGLPHDRDHHYNCCSFLTTICDDVILRPIHAIKISDFTKYKYTNYIGHIEKGENNE